MCLLIKHPHPAIIYHDLYSGTSVSEGSGRVLVLAVGPHSEWGRTLALVVKEPENTPLQDKLWALAKVIAIIGLVTAVVCFIALLIRCAVAVQCGDACANGLAAGGSSWRAAFLWTSLRRDPCHSSPLRCAC